MDYVIGVDCGGTKTEAEAYSLEGQLLASSQSGFGNLVVNYESGIAHIKEAIEAIFNQLPKEDCLEITLGIAGIDSGGLREKVKEDVISYNKSINLINDGMLAHYSILKGQDGVTITAGTGSVVLALFGEDWYRVGGWGQLFGDQGGAYDIAKKAIQQALEEFDLDISPSKLTRHLFTYFDVSTVFELTKKVYTLDKGDIAAAAIIVAELAREDVLAEKIINQAGQDLAVSVLRILKKIPETNTPIQIGLNGSVIEKNEFVLNALRQKLDSDNLVYNLHKKKESCAKGAYYLNQRNGDNK